MSSRVILASASTSRASILSKLGVQFEQRPTNAAEDLDRSLYTGRLREYCDDTCSLKLSALSASFGDDKDSPVVCIAADTVVICGGRILEKPSDAEHAKNMLMLYSECGEAEIYTCMGILTRSPDGGSSDFVIRKHGQATRIIFRKFDRGEVEKYLDFENVRNNSGALAILESSGRWVKSIEGCIYNALGLPMSALIELLADGTLADII